MIKVELEFISDTDMYFVFEKAWETEFFIFLRDLVKPTIRF